MTRRPLPNRRLSRAQLVQAVTAREQQRDRAEGKARATLDFCASWLSSRADGYDKDARNEQQTGPLTAKERYAVAAELRALAVDIEGGPK